MRIYKTRWFHKWAARQGISDQILNIAIAEMSSGLIDANLGGNVFKKRIGRHNRGKSAGTRSLLVFRERECAFFIYGFQKNERDNIDALELRALKSYARELLGYSDMDLVKAINAKILFEVNNDGS